MYKIQIENGIFTKCIPTSIMIILRSININNINSANSILQINGVYIDANNMFINTDICLDDNNLLLSPLEKNNIKKLIREYNINTILK